MAGHVWSLPGLSLLSLIFGPGVDVAALFGHVEALLPVASLLLSSWLCGGTEPPLQSEVLLVFAMASRGFTNNGVCGSKSLSWEEVWTSKLMMALDTTSRVRKDCDKKILSPFLFNIVADILSILIKRTKDDNQIRAIIPHLVDDGLSILQYADDTIIFIDQDLEEAKNMKLLLCVFEQLSVYTELFGCELGSYAFRYLGILMHFHKLHNADWGVIEDRFKHKLSTWKAKHLSYGGRLVFLNSVLSSLPMFMISFFEIPKGVMRRLDFYRSIFFWQGSNDKQKYRLARLRSGKTLGWDLTRLKISLYNIVHYPHKIAANVFAQMPINITFRRSLVGDKLIAWHNLLAKIANVQLSTGRDIFILGLRRYGYPFHKQFHLKVQDAIKNKDFLMCSPSAGSVFVHLKPLKNSDRAPRADQPEGYGDDNSEAIVLKPYLHKLDDDGQSKLTVGMVDVNPWGGTASHGLSRGTAHVSQLWPSDRRSTVWKSQESRRPGATECCCTYSAFATLPQPAADRHGPYLPAVRRASYHSSAGRRASPPAATPPTLSPAAASPHLLTHGRRRPRIRHGRRRPRLPEPDPALSSSPSLPPRLPMVSSASPCQRPARLRRFLPDPIAAPPPTFSLGRGCRDSSPPRPRVSIGMAGPCP
ncbi:hypothetical protein U9M48_040491 [Paspalum notatum var. saurae]|uniref:Reverse transcriptase domain-containing protein n=1 Tax=Paspalum notatum var. saurae TaxID=547442 RepID=A0AAQ3UR72_PASNO